MMEELGRDEIDAILDANVVGRIGCHADGCTYVVPIIYAREGESVYVATVEGRKVRMMRANPEVCFEVDEYPGTGGWRSVIADGTYVEQDEDGSRHALALLARRFGREPGTGRRPASGARATICFRIDLSGPTGRAARR